MRGKRDRRNTRLASGSVGRHLVTPFLVLSLVAVACGSGDGAGDGSSVVGSEVDRADAAPDLAQPFSAAIGSFGWDLYQELASPDANLVFSPHSIGMALAMTRAGAAGETAAELDRVLHLDGVAAPHGGANAVDLALAAAAGEHERPDGSTAEIEIGIANALWSQEGFGFQEPFLTTLAESYGSAVRVVDFVGASEETRGQINQWVADRTADRIGELIGPGVLSADTRTVLTNAVYLRAPWEYPFDEGGTAPAPFVRLDGSEFEVELMSVNRSLRYARIGEVQAVELPYAGGRLSMVVVVPDHGAFPMTASTMDRTRFDELLDGLQPTEVHLRLPAFGFETNAGLVPPLVSLGLGSAFDPDRADFSAMTTEAPLFVSDVVHEAFIAVDEDGTEAAAATAVVMDLTAAPAEVVELTVDRPFLFAIAHGDSRSVLFLGHVVRPERHGGEGSG